jgi:hypothetical protein
MRTALAFALLILPCCTPDGSSPAGSTDSSGVPDDPSTGDNPTLAGPESTSGTTGPDAGAGTSGEHPGGSGGGTGGAECPAGDPPAAGEPWGPCRDELPEDPSWSTRCDGGIFCTEMPGLGTICRPPCEFPPGDPAAGECPCGAPGGEAKCAPLGDPLRPDRPCDVPCAGGCPDGMACADPGDWCYWQGQGIGGGPADPPPPPPECEDASWPPAPGQPWGPCLGGFSCEAGSECRVAGSTTICEPACVGPEVIDCPAAGCFGYPAELFCTAGPGSPCELLCTWGPGDLEGECPDGMACDPQSRCAWLP